MVGKSWKSAGWMTLYSPTDLWLCSDGNLCRYVSEWEMMLRFHEPHPFHICTANRKSEAEAGCRWKWISLGFELGMNSALVLWSFCYCEDVLYHNCTCYYLLSVLSFSSRLLYHSQTGEALHLVRSLLPFSTSPCGFRCKAEYWDLTVEIFSPKVGAGKKNNSGNVG